MNNMRNKHNSIQSVINNVYIYMGSELPLHSYLVCVVPESGAARSCSWNQGSSEGVCACMHGGALNCL